VHGPAAEHAHGVVVVENQLEAHGQLGVGQVHVGKAGELCGERNVARRVEGGERREAKLAHLRNTGGGGQLGDTGRG